MADFLSASADEWNGVGVGARGGKADRRGARAERADRVKREAGRARRRRVVGLAIRGCVWVEVAQRGRTEWLDGWLPTRRAGG